MLFWHRRRRRLNTIVLAAFGKHPAWDDHVDDLGIQNERILAFQRAVYHQGIATHVNTGVWDRMPLDERIEGFEFWLCSSRLSYSDNTLVGRVWSSSDGKGRTRYPMIACIDCGQMTLSWAFGPAIAALEDVAQTCIRLSEENQVRRVVREIGDRLRQDSSSTSVEHYFCEPKVNTTDIVSKLIHAAPSVFDEEGMSRVIYQIQRDLPSYLKKSKRKDQGTSKSSSILRVPRCVDSPTESVRLWLRFAMDWFKSGTPIMILAPLHHDWIDLLIGEPVGPLLWCMRTGLKGFPMTNSIPYQVDRSSTGNDL